MTQKNRTLEGKNRTLGGEGGQKSSKIVGHHLCTFPYAKQGRGQECQKVEFQATEMALYSSLYKTSEVIGKKTANIKCFS